MSARDWGRWLAGGAVAALLVGWLLPGCQKRPEPVHIAGKVQEEGAEAVPVAQAILGFHPQDEINKEFSYQARTDSEGRFSLACIQGKYKVTVVLLPKPIPKEEKSEKIDKFKQKELDLKKLTEPKKPGPGPNPNPKPPPEPDPDVLRFLNYRTPNTTPLSIEVPPEGKTDIFLLVKPG